MVKKRKTQQREPDPRAERHTYKGHEIVVTSDDPGRRVLVDDEPIRYGRVGEEFYLEVYAYDRDPSLLAVVRRYIDHRDQAASRQEENTR